MQRRNSTLDDQRDSHPIGPELLEAAPDSTKGGIVIVDAEGRITFANDLGRQWLRGFEDGRRHRNSLLDCERSYRALFECSLDAILVADEEANLVDANPEASHLIGCSREELLSMSVFDLAPPPDKETARRMWADFKRKGEMRGQCCLTRRDGCAVDVGFSATDAGPGLYQLVIRDLEMDPMRDQFVSVAAHELKTPVTIMKGYAQALQRKGADLSPERRRMLDAIDRGSDRIDRLVNDLLDISRLQDGQLQLAKEPIDLASLVNDVVDRMAAGAPNHQLRVVSDAPAMVLGDRSRLEKVVATVVDNAIRYSPHGGKVDVEVGRRDRDAVVHVIDRGVGIPREHQGRVFQRFYRAHTNTPHDYGGMGIGLYISREIISRHGGKMEFESVEGVGSTFSFSLPARSDDVSA
jgi:PAS domain S-box-containing protein